MNKLVYASDLDQTLIFSRSYLSEHPCSDELVCVEHYMGKELSYMSKSVQSALVELMKDHKVKFIPVTTRDVMRYRRLNLGSRISPQYAIVANGGVILHNNRPVPEWSRIVREQINCDEMSSIIHYCCARFVTRTTSVSIVDSVLILFKVEDTSEFDERIFDLQCQNWRFIRQGHKCYAIPKHVTKGAALKWLADQIGADFIVATGDGPLDLSMLRIANMAIVPDTSGIEERFCLRAKNGAISALTTINTVKMKIS